MKFLADCSEFDLWGRKLTSPDNRCLNEVNLFVLMMAKVLDIPSQELERPAENSLRR